MGHDHHVPAPGRISHLDDPETPDGITYLKIKSISKCLKMQKGGATFGSAFFY
jgi:hypothetical protein